MANLFLGSYEIGRLTENITDFGYGTQRSFESDVRAIVDVYYNQNTGNDFCTSIYCELKYEGWTTDTEATHIYCPSRTSKELKVYSDNSMILNLLDSSTERLAFGDDIEEDTKRKYISRKYYSDVSSNDEIKNKLSHNLDGTKSIQIYSEDFGFSLSHYDNDGGMRISSTFSTDNINIVIDLPEYTRATVINTANNFDDMSNAEFSYTVPVSHTKSNVTSIEACLSLDGVNAFIPYRAIPLTSSTYTFELTEEQRELFRNTITTNNTAPIYYITKTVCSNGTDSITTYGVAERIIAIAGCNPQLSPAVKDINTRTLALTGNENTFVKYFSDAEFYTGATAGKYAVIVNQYVTNGAKTVENLTSGVIEGVESNTFYFGVTDSRQITTRDFIVVDFIPYVKLTASIASAKLNTDGVLTFTVTGNYYKGSFGAKDNSLEFEYSIREENGDVSWNIITPKVKYSGNTYTIEHSITGLDYMKKYTITANVIDELMSVQTSPKVVTSIPVFDWSETDFRHNTNVYLENGKTLRAKNTNGDDVQILGASGNNISFGYGSYSAEIGKSILYGDTINIVSNKGVTIDGRIYGENKILWSGAYHMNDKQSITLSEKVSNQPNGIVLVFSLYRDGLAENVSINSFFVSKQEVELLAGAPHTFLMAINAGFSNIGAKYLYIDDNIIEGHEGNTMSGTNSGITFNNSMYVLRYVIGI